MLKKVYFIKKIKYACNNKIIIKIKIKIFDLKLLL